MAPARHVIVAGAGIAGLTAALALARAGLRATVLEQTTVLEEAGAGIQLSPNATRVLIELGLHDRLLPLVTTPQAICVMAASSAREIVRIPLGEAAQRQYGAPFWTIHRADLQAVLASAAQTTQDITLKLGTKLDDFVVHVHGVTVQARSGRNVVDERGVALIGADGLWSGIAKTLKLRAPRFQNRTAWRALVPAESVAAEFREPLVHLWLGSDAHLVHYPVKGGRLINIVGIVPDQWHDTGWQAVGERDVILRQFARWSWADKARDLIAIPEQWRKWALYERTPFNKSVGPVTLIGDAAHPMLPFLAQGAGMAIEDAAVLGAMLGKYIDDPVDALRAYEGARHLRTARAQRASRRQARIYGRGGPEALVRNLGMKLLGGERLRRRYDWLYTWQPPEIVPSNPSHAL